MMQGTDAAQEAMMQRGELPPGAHIGIQREGITLLYTAVDATYHDVVTEYPLVQETAPRYRRAGINLASHALTLLRVPEVIDRVRQAPYPRLHVLLDAIGDAEVKFDDHDDWRFVLPGFGGQLRPLRLDEIPLTATPSQARTGTHNSILPARPQTDSATVQDVLSSVDTARALRLPSRTCRWARAECQPCSSNQCRQWRGHRPMDKPVKYKQK
jgi:hypothetical protein